MSTLYFSHDRFGDLMTARKDISFKKKDNHGWTAHSHAAMEYSCNGFDYTTWHHEVSLVPGGTVALVSCKIDQRRFGKDDHMVLLASVAKNQATLTVQAAMQSIKDGVHGKTGMIFYQEGRDTGDRLAQAVADNIKIILKGKEDDGFSNFAPVARINLQCLAASCLMH